MRRMSYGEMASRKGIEPLTPGLGNLCSILLSYRDPLHWRRASNPALPALFRRPAPHSS